MAKTSTARTAAKTTKKPVRAAKSATPKLPKAIDAAIEAARDRKATGVVVLDLKKTGAFTD